MFLHRYFRHASGEMYVISQALAKFVSINRWVFFLINWFLHLSLCRALTWILVSCSAEIFSVPTPMMMSVSDLGLLGLMLNILMTPSFAAPLGRVVCLSHKHTHTKWKLIKFGGTPLPFHLIYFLRWFFLSQEPFVLVYDLICFDVVDKVTPDAGRWFERHWIHIH